MAKTMVGMVSPLAAGAAPTENQPAAAANQTPAKKNFGGTMLGMPSPVAPQGNATPRAPQQSPPAASSVSATAQASAALQQTQVGATPPAVSQGSYVGATTAKSNTGALPSAGDAETPREKRKFQGTLLGVAQPGIAPTHDAPAPPQAFPGAAMQTPTPSLSAQELPAEPATTHAEVPPAASTPQSVRPPQSVVPVARRLPVAKRPLWQPIALVGGGLLVAAALGGLVAKLRERATQIVVTEFSVNSDGQDELSLMCPDCPDKSILQLGDASTTFEGGRAVIQPEKPLSLGVNEFELLLNDKDGEPISVKPLVVPVAFRMSTNWNGMAKDPPYGEVVVDAPAGSKVTIGGQPQTLHQGKLTYQVPLAQVSLGESRQRTKFKKELEVVVESDGKTRKATALLQGVILPLSLTSVGPVHQLSGKDVTVAGVTTPGATVSVGAVQAKANESGLFSLVLPAPSPATLAVEATMENHILRRVPLELTKSAKVAPESVTSFSKITDGANVNLLGNVIESRIADGVTQTLFEVESGCETAPCLMRGVYAEPHHLIPNRKVRVAGLAAAGDPVTVRVRLFH